MGRRGKAGGELDEPDMIICPVPKKICRFIKSPAPDYQVTSQNPIHISRGPIGLGFHHFS